MRTHLRLSVLHQRSGSHGVVTTVTAVVATVASVVSVVVFVTITVVKLLQFVYVASYL